MGPHVDAMGLNVSLGALCVESVVSLRSPSDITDASPLIMHVPSTHAHTDI